MIEVADDSITYKKNHRDILYNLAPEIAYGKNSLHTEICALEWNKEVASSTIY